ncbi:S8 family serine peptidase [Bdellovibrio sp.]|uniref:S8 family serine peptidase n=1 Tax=Bdellovibrio sp. TaxID=28201 RepID=UPI0039E71263
MFSKSNFILSLFITITLLGCTSAQEKNHTLGESHFVEGEVIVGVKTHKRSAFAIKSFTKAIAIRSFKAVDAMNLDREGRFLHLKLEKNEPVAAAIKRLQSHEDVEFVQPNYIYHPTAIPDDPHFGKLWGLQNNGQKIEPINQAQDLIKDENNPGTAGRDISATAAWDIITDCSSVIVAVLDSGAKLDHEDLVNNLWTNPVDGSHGYNPVDGTNDPTDIISGHGTHVASTIAAEGNNSKGSTGVCWKAKIMPVKVLNDLGAGTTANIIAGISYAVSFGAKIINMSLGGPTGKLDDLAYLTAIGNAENILFIVSSGNGGADGVGDNNDLPNMKQVPCNFSTGLNNVICVGAVDQAFALADYSNYGKTSVQISAPGTNILGLSPTTEILYEEDFQNGWYQSADANWLRDSTEKNLKNPINYDRNSNNYNHNLRSSAYKTYNFPDADKVLLELSISIDLEKNVDYLRLAVDRNVIGTDIFTNPSVHFNEPLQLPGNLTGNWGIALRKGSSWGPVKDHPTWVLGPALDISKTCAKTVCTLGFQLNTNSQNNDFGVKIFGIKTHALTSATNSYKIIAGTSMATPHVTGAAALVWAYNPNYSLSDVKEAILNGGTAMNGLKEKTSTGKVLNVMGSLAFIKKPATPVITIK